LKLPLQMEKAIKKFGNLNKKIHIIIKISNKVVN
jgi:hypothetical protein